MLKLEPDYVCKLKIIYTFVRIFNLIEMKKHIFSLLVGLMVTSVSVSAQDIFNNPNNKPYFGVRVGVDISCPGKVSSDGFGVDAFSNGAGVEFGGIYNIPVVANFYIEPGLKLFYDTYGMKDLFDDSFDKMSYSNRFFGFRIPVMLGYHFDFTDDIKVSVFTGPELELGLVGKSYLKSGKYQETTNLYSEDGGYNRPNLLWDFGAGVSYQNFYLSVTGGVGLLDLSKDTDTSFHCNRATISLGYNF